MAGGAAGDLAAAVVGEGLVVSVVVDRVVAALAGGGRWKIFITDF